MEETGENVAPHTRHHLEAADTSNLQLLQEPHRRPVEGISLNVESVETLPTDITNYEEGSELVTNQPAAFVNFKSDESLKARKIVHQVLKANPKARGVGLLVHNQDAPQDIGLPPLYGIETGTTELHTKQTLLDLAVIRLENPSTKLFKAVVDEMTSQSCREMYSADPETFKYFVFYSTGHGTKQGFFTKDGAISYSFVYEKFQGLFQQRYFFFDCCRSKLKDRKDHSKMTLFPGITDRDIPGHDIQAGNMIVYATLNEDRSWGPGGGVSFMTLKMIELFKQNLSIDMMVIKLKEQVSCEVINPETGKQQQPLMISGTQLEVNLMKERDQAMKPELRLVTVHTDGTTALINVCVPSPINPKLFPDMGCCVQMKSCSGEWISLSVLTETTTRQQTDFDDSSSEGITSEVSPSTDSSQGRLVRKLTVLLPTDRPVGNAFFRVTALKPNLDLSSNEKEVPVPCIAKPEVHSATIVLRDCHQPEVEVSFKLFKSSLRFIRITMNIYKNDCSDPVHQHDVEYEHGKINYDCGFLVKELTNHEHKDNYKLSIEVERDVDEKRIISDLADMDRYIYAPKLNSDPEISPDGAVATVVVSFDSHLSDGTFNEEDYQVQMKVQGSNEWKAQKRFICPPSEDSPLVCRTPSDNELSTRQVPVSVALPTDRHEVLNTDAFLRVVSQRSESLCLPSNRLKVVIPCIARPRITANPHIDFCNAEPTATVGWQIQQPLSIQWSRYNLRIYKKRKGSREEWDCVHTEHIPYIPGRGEQDHHFSVPELANSEDSFDYEVTVEAERVDQEKLCSSRTPMTIVKAKPKILANPRICFSNRAKPKATVAWEFQPSLDVQFSKYNVHIHKREGEGEWTLVHTEYSPHCSGLTRYEQSFSIPALAHHEDTCHYEVAVEALADQENICSNWIAMTIIKVRPRITGNPQIDFSSAAEPTATVAWKPLGIQVSRYSLHIYKKRKNHPEDWVCVHTEHVPFISDQTEQNLDFPVPELANSEDYFEYEVAVEAERADQERIFSDRTGMSIVKAKPTISADTHIRFSNHAQPEATVAWELRPSLGTHFSGFNVHIRKRDGEGEWTTVRTKPFPYQANQTKRCETFSVPELVNHEDRYTYGVVVEAKCEGLESLHSNQVAIAIRKGCCYGLRTTTKCVCRVFLSALFAVIAGTVCASLVLAILIVQSEQRDIYANTSWSPEYQVFVVELANLPPINALLELDLSNRYVYKTHPDNSEMNVYCNDYQNHVLSNSRRVRYVEIFQQPDSTLNNTSRFLPIGSIKPDIEYALSQSNLSVSLFVSNTSLRTKILPFVQLQLHKKVDQYSWAASKNPTLASVKVAFDSNFYSNSTVVVSEPAVVFLTLFTPEDVHFKWINASAKILHYSPALGLVNVSNLIETKKLIPGSVDSTLVCNVSWKQPFNIDYQAIQVSFPLKWKENPLTVFLCVAVASLLLCVYFSICTCVLCKNQGECCKRQKHHKGYECIQET